MRRRGNKKRRGGSDSPSDKLHKSAEESSRKASEIVAKQSGDDDRHRMYSATDGDDTDTAANVVLAVDAPAQSRWRKFAVRTSVGFAMIIWFLCMVAYTQQLGCASIIILAQVMVYKEICEVAITVQRERELPGFWLLYIYWFFVAMFSVYGRILEPHLLMHSFHNLLGFRMSEYVKEHQFFSFIFYCMGFCGFVLNLRRRRHYRYQFKQFAFCHVALFIVVFQGSCAVANMFEGLIWFLLPTSITACNDIWAYFFGFFFGRTPLIKLSPKKTWEGFLGGGLATIVWSFLFSRFLSRFALMRCPAQGFGLEFWPDCEMDPIFQYVAVQDYMPSKIVAHLPAFLRTAQMMPMDVHAFWIAMFGSLVAPFGGFFASGFKRAFKIKDFGDSIPGHGGITDRMDCQILTALFVYIYHASCVAHTTGYVSYTMNLIGELREEDQVKIFESLGESLKARGLLGMP